MKTMMEDKDDGNYIYNSCVMILSMSVCVRLIINDIDKMIYKSYLYIYIPWISMDHGCHGRNLCHVFHVSHGIGSITPSPTVQAPTQLTHLSECADAFSTMP